jgi:RNA polymerase sigma factor (sigma-70 family)
VMDREGRNALVESNGWLVQALASKLARRLPPSFELEDLVQQGQIGLMQAAERFDPERGSSFPMYAQRRVRGAMFDFVRRRHWRNATLAPLKTARDCASAENIDQRIARKQEAREVWRAVALLPDRERTIISLYYAGGLTNEQIGPAVNLKGRRVAQIHREALDQLRHDLQRLRPAA